MGRHIEYIKRRWAAMRASGSLHNLAVFLIFVMVSALFWFVLALNDNVQDSFDVRVELSNVPDSVTFITEPPATLHVSVRDKGTVLLRSGMLHQPTVHFNFKDYASGGVFRMSRTDLLAAMKSAFGNTAQIASMSVDSLRLPYTTAKGRRVPVVVVADVMPSPGYVISGVAPVSHSSVLVYSNSQLIDTLNRVYTTRIVRRDLSESTEVTVQLNQIPEVRMIPDRIKVKIGVEPLVSKESLVNVTAINVPAGESLLLFPSKVSVKYFVPMSRFGDDDAHVEVIVDYDDILRIHSNRLPLQLGQVGGGLFNVELKADSVEYTLMRD